MSVGKQSALRGSCCAKHGDALAAACPMALRALSGELCLWTQRASVSLRAKPAAAAWRCAAVAAEPRNGKSRWGEGDCVEPQNGTDEKFAGWCTCVPF